MAAREFRKERREKKEDVNIIVRSIDDIKINLWYIKLNNTILVISQINLC
jgi:hypothetical protein